MVIHTGWISCLGHRCYDCTFETGGHSDLAEGGVEYVREHIPQLFCPVLQNTAWYTVWSGSLPRVDVGEDPLNTIRR